MILSGQHLPSISHALVIPFVKLDSRQIDVLINKSHYCLRKIQVAYTSAIFEVEQIKCCDKRFLRYREYVNQ